MSEGRKASRALFLFAAASAALSAGCAGEDPVEHEHPDAGAPAARCPEETPEFTIGPNTGLEAIGNMGAVTARLLDAQYVPPEIYRNDWTVAFFDQDGEPLADVEITEARAYMPVHRHDGKFPPVITALDGPGEFQVDDLNLWMGGPWEVQFWVTSETAGDDYLVFDVCVDD